ncbi:unnamed protein product, partial [Staurois parvus]
ARAPSIFWQDTAGTESTAETSGPRVPFWQDSGLPTFTHRSRQWVNPWSGHHGVGRLKFLSSGSTAGHRVTRHQVIWLASGHRVILGKAVGHRGTRYDKRL